MVTEKNAPPKKTRKKKSDKLHTKKKRGNLTLIIEILPRVFCVISKIGQDDIILLARKTLMEG